MMQSLVDYVLERGNVDYGEFAPRKQMDNSSVVFNHRKLLQYLFQQNETTVDPNNREKRISDMKIQEISGQLNYLSQKIHAQLNRKNLVLDGDLYKLENQWLKKKIPDFYSYYFLKFAYANSYSRMHELFLSELENMNRQKNSYIVIKKTIEARQVCLANLRRQISTINDLDVDQSLQTIKQQRLMKSRKAVQNQNKGYKSKKDDEQVGKSWKNKLQMLFESLSHCRKLTSYVVQLIKNWKNGIYGISQDPRRYRQRVIFFHNDANYILKMLFDTRFVNNSFLKDYVKFSNTYDPFFLKPIMILQNKQNKTIEEEIFLSLLKPSDPEMDKITRSLIMMAQEQYDQDQQSRFINDKKNFGQLQQRKKMIDKKRDSLGLKNRVQSQAKILPSQKAKIQNQQRKSSKQQGNVLFSKDKKSSLTQQQLEQVKFQKQEHNSKIKVQSSLKRIKNIRSVDLKKISPYLSRNQRIQKAQKVVQLEYKFKLAQSQYAEHLKSKKDEIKHTKMNQKWAQENKDIANSKIFNKYIQQNLRIMDEANKKAYLYKNKVSPKKHSAVAESMNYNKVSFHDRKQAEYQRNLQKYKKPQSKEQRKSYGTKGIIQISNKGIRSSETAFDFEMYGKKGKNVGQILQKQKKQRQKSSIEQKLTVNASKLIKNESPEQKQAKQLNLFESQRQAQIIVMRQQPEKIQQIKKFLYNQIKQQLMQQMKRNTLDKQQSINTMIEQQKRKRISDIMEKRRQQQLRKKQQEEKIRISQMEKQRKKIDFDVKIQPIQYAEENVNQFFQAMFQIKTNTYERIFTYEKLSNIKQMLLNEVHIIFLRAFFEGQLVGYCVAHHNWRIQSTRVYVIDYITVAKQWLYVSTFHQVSQFLWHNDPVEQIQISMLKNQQNNEGNKLVDDIQQYALRYGQSFEKRLYSNIIQFKYVWTRPQVYRNAQFPYTHYYFGKKLNFKAQLLSAHISLHQRQAPIIDMNLETFTNYVFLLQELFRSYLTPQQVVQLRQNSTNIRRLKDIFRIVLELEKQNPKIDQLTVVEGLNLDDLYSKLKQKLTPPYQKYYWPQFYDKTTSNRLLLSILQANLQLQFPINSCYLDDRKFLRINPRRKVLVLKSSVYSKQYIYVLNTNNPKIRIFLMQGQAYKLMRIELFIFLNLVFNNIVQDTQKFVNSFWMPQFVINSDAGKQVKRITDFSISMKKSFFLSEEIYFCNHDYIKHGISLLPKASDVMFRESVIFGFLHTGVEKGSTGMPLYAKLIDRDQMF